MIQDSRDKTAVEEKTVDNTFVTNTRFCAVVGAHYNVVPAKSIEHS